MYITKDPVLALLAANAGVDRIFVDLENLGKIERQGHLNTLISHHTIKDVETIRQALLTTNLLVRINPYHENIEQEVSCVMQFNPQMIMLPMYRTLKEVERVSEFIAGRAELIPLLETPDALNNVNEASQVPGVSEIYIGLNDLHIALNLKFMFLLLLDGTVERISKIIKSHGKRFGFGGIARLGEGLLPSEYILAEHERLGSSSVILSRTFHRLPENLDKVDPKLDFFQEIKKLRDYERRLELRTEEERQKGRKTVADLTQEIVDHA